MTKNSSSRAPMHQNYLNLGNVNLLIHRGFGISDHWGRFGQPSRRLVLIVLFALPLLLLAATPLLAQEPDPFDPAPVWVDPISQNSLSVVWGDLDSDGDLDMVVGTLNQGIRIFTNEDGVLAKPLVLPDIYEAGSLALGDLDGDGDLDLAVGHGHFLFKPNAQPNAFYLNQTSPGAPIELLPAEVDWSTPPGAVPEITATTTDIALADINGDGMLDLAVVDDGLVYVYHNLTDPASAPDPQAAPLLTFASLLRACPEDGPLLDGPKKALQLGFGDVNNDGKPDLAIAFNDLTEVWVNDGVGCFGPTATLLPLFGYPNDIEWGDFNNDGFEELAVAISNARNVVFANQGGQLGTAYDLDGLTELSRAIAWGDADGDGDLDLAVANSQPNPNRVYLNEGYANDGAPKFVLAWTDPIPRETLDARWADLDGDRDLDLATAVYAAPDLVIENLSASLMSSPINDQSGAVGTASQLSAESVAWGDMDNDGDLDLAVGYSSSKKPTLVQNLTDNQWPERPARDAVYENKNGVLIWATPWLSDDAAPTTSIAWGDFDADGRLDLAAGHHGGEVKVYRNAPVDNAQGADEYKLEMAASCTINVASDELRLKVLQNIDLIQQLRADAALLAAVRADDDLLGKLLADKDAFAAIDTDTALFERLRNDHELMSSLLDDSSFADLFSLSYETGSVVTGAPDGSVTGSVEKMYALVEEIAKDDWSLLFLFLDLIRVIGTGDEAALADWYARIEIEGDEEQRQAVKRFTLELGLDTVTRTAIWSADDVSDTHLLAYLLTDDDLLGGKLRNLFYLAPAGALSSLAWGDVNSDGFLDLAVGLHGGINRVYLYDRDSGCFTVGNWLPSVEPEPEDLTLLPLQRVKSGNTYALAWGDVDNDGDLDLAVGNHTGDVSGDGNRDFVYLNQGGMLTDEPAYVIGSDPTSTRGLAWGDMDGDGDLDLATVTWSGQKRVFENEAGVLQPEPRWISADTDLSTSVAWGDADGDGDLDLAVGNVSLFGAGVTNDVYYNRNGMLDSSPGWQSSSAHNTHSVAWGDLDGDGLLDLAVGNQQDPLEIYAGKEPRPRFGSQIEPTLSIGLHAEPTITASGVQSMLLAPADFQAVPNARASDVISIPYRLTDSAQRPVRRVVATYSLNGTEWQPAIPSASTVTENLTTSLPTDLAAEPHIFGWNLQDQDAQAWLFGQVTNVVFRMEAYPSLRPAPGDVAGSYQRGGLAAQTYPFPANGIQIQVFQEDGSAAEGAIVYRLPKLQREGATRLESANGDVYRSGPDGILIGQGELNKNDQLIAMLPISATHAYTLYLTSGVPNEKTVKMRSVTAPMLIPLTVTTASPLYLFNLDVSLEWDAGVDHEFMAQLGVALQNASSVLFDITNGQVALGDVRVHNNKKAWTSADVVIYASNSIHPRAVMGGVVNAPIVDEDFAARRGIVGEAADTLPPTYTPGQIHMGPLWDPFGQSQVELQVDWWRAFAHELGHYLLFLPDNYLGVEGGVLTTIDCQGSFMTNAYDEDDYGELLKEDEWPLSECPKTVAEQLLSGRSDWETVQKYLPAVQMPEAGKATNSGPKVLPLGVTRMIWEADEVGAASQAIFSGLLTPRNYDLRDEAGNLAQLQNAEAYLYKGGNDQGGGFRATEIIPLGSTGAGHDRIKARGAQSGDRICVFDPHHQPPRVGCENSLSRQTQSIGLELVDDWRPDIVVSPVSSRTFAITVTQAVSPGGILRVQAVPAYGPPTEPHKPAATGALAMDPVINATAVTDTQPITTWTKTITLSHPSFEGFVRVWEPSLEPRSAPPREAISQYFLSAGWGPPVRGDKVDRRLWGPPVRGDKADSRLWGPPVRGDKVDNRAWNANQRTLEAPVASGDGRVTIFNMDDILETPGETSLQGLSELPGLDPWLAPVGKGYRFATEQPSQPGDPNLTMAFHYLQRDVPDGFEHALAVYFRPKNGDTWQKLDTRLFQEDNMAVAPMPDPAQQSPEGVYALVAAVELPPLQPGWNLLAYTIPQTRTVASALASLAGDYSVVHGYDSTVHSPWLTFDPQFAREHPELFTSESGSPVLAAQLGALEQLDYGHSYLIHVTATEPVTPVLAVPGVRTIVPAGSKSSNVAATDTFNDLAIAPAAVFGEVSTDSDGSNRVGSFAGLELRALITDLESGEAELCGIANIQLAEDGSCFYVLRIDSASKRQGCGTVGREVNLYLEDGTTAVDTFLWDNRQISNRPLTIH